MSKNRQKEKTPRSIYRPRKICRVRTGKTGFGRGIRFGSVSGVGIQRGLLSNHDECSASHAGPARVSRFDDADGMGKGRGLREGGMDGGRECINDITILTVYDALIAEEYK